MEQVRGRDPAGPGPRPLPFRACPG